MDVVTALEGNWEFRVEHKGISIYSSTIEGSDILGFKGETEFQVSYRKLIALFNDFPSYRRWVHQIADMEVLDRNDELEYIIRQVINAPWPMQQREMIVRTSLHTAGESAVAVTMQGMPDYLPPNPDYFRVRELHGVWIFTPTTEGRIHITFVMHMNPGGDVPAALSNTALFEVPFYSLQKLRNLALDPSYNPQFPEELQEHLGFITDVPGRQ